MIRLMNVISRQGLVMFIISIIRYLLDSKGSIFVLLHTNPMTIIANIIEIL